MMLSTLLMMALMMRMAMMMNENWERFAEGGRHLAAALMSSAAGRPQFSLAN